MNDAFRAALTEALHPFGFETIQFRDHEYRGMGVGLEWSDGRHHAVAFQTDDARLIPQIVSLFEEWLSIPPPPVAGEVPA